MPLTDNWNAVVGSWEILTGELHEKVGGGGTANALIFCKHGVPTRSAGEMRVEVDITNATVGNVYYVYVCCASDSSIGSGTTVEFKYFSAGTWKTTITGAGAEGITYQIGSASVRVFVCADREHLMISAGLIVDPDNPYAWNDNFDPGTGCYAALGHNNVTTGATFDNFLIEEIRTGTEECLYCWCQCLAEPLKRTLYAEIINVTLCGGDDLSFFNCTGYGTNLEWTWHPAYSPTWDGSITCDFRVWDISLDCEFTWALYPSNPGKNIGLVVDFSTEGALLDPASTCEPLSLVFGPYYILEFVDPPVVPPDPDPNKACFYLRITEL